MRSIVLLLALVGNSCLAAGIYTWVDANGVRHFAASPPPGQMAQPVDRRTGLSSVTPPPVTAPAEPSTPKKSPEQEAIDRKVRQQVAEDRVKLQQLCTELRTSLSQLKNNPRIRVETEGQVRRVTEEERQQHITETERKIAEHCQ